MGSLIKSYIRTFKYAEHVRIGSGLRLGTWRSRGGEFDCRSVWGDVCCSEIVVQDGERASGCVDYGRHVHDGDSFRGASSLCSPAVWSRDTQPRQQIHR